MNIRITFATDLNQYNGHLAHLENTHIILNDKIIKVFKALPASGIMIQHVSDKCQ